MTTQNSQEQNLKLQSATSCVSLSQLGAAVTSWRVNGQEVMGKWPSSQGGTTSDFVIGPVIGHATHSGSVLHDGQIFEPGKHGFARKTDFTAKDEAAKIELSHSHDPIRTPNMYPFAHDISVTYALAGNTLATNLAVRNDSNEDMFFGAGLHPAFAFSTEDSLVKLATALPEGTKVYRTLDGKVRASAITNSPFENLLWRINTKTFDEDAYFFVFPQIIDKNVEITLTTPEQNKTLIATLNGWGGFGIWSKPGKQDFICIEPLVGVSVLDEQDAKTPRFSDINGLSKLPSGKIFAASFKTEVLVN